jgi:predicted GH43/DUF377 family glycosyl hydrolase
MKLILQTLFFFLLVTQICYSQENWTKYGVVLSGPSGYVWDIFLETPCVLYNGEYNRFEMWFSAIGWTPYFNPAEYKIGFAYSNDGISWTLHPDPVLEPSEGTWDSLAVGEPFVIRENGQYKMWYSSSDQDFFDYKIGYATSEDGINWTKYNANPIFEAGTNSFETGGVYGCCIMPYSGGYKMWYTVYDTSTTHSTICYAISADGILWQKDTLNNPVLEYGEPGEWDEKGIFFPRVLFLNNLYYMYYGGEDYIVDPFNLFEIGLAISPDGIRWKKSDSNPVLSPSQNYYYNAGIQSSSVMLNGDTLIMWYDGFYEPTCGGKADVDIYLAKSFFDVTTVDIPIPHPTDYVLMQNYPTPFNPSTKIKYAVPQSSNVVIKVFDILGNQIATLMDEEKPVGIYELTWNASNLPSGVYFYQLNAGEFISTKKMILLK